MSKGMEDCDAVATCTQSSIIVFAGMSAFRKDDAYVPHRSLRHRISVCLFLRTNHRRCDRPSRTSHAPLMLTAAATSHSDRSIRGAVASSWLPLNVRRTPDREANFR